MPRLSKAQQDQRMRGRHVKLSHKAVRLARADEPAGARVIGDVTVDELLHLAVEVGGIGIYESDFERDRTRFSPELCAILGLPVGTEMTFTQASQLFDERDLPAVQASLEAAARSADRGRWRGVHRVLRADGAIRWVSIQGRRLYRETPNGPQPVRSIGTVIDITHLKETEEAIRESELRLRLALDAAQMGTFEADIAASHALIDTQEARLLGLPDDTRIVSADELRKRMPLEDLSASDAKQERLTQHHEPYHHEFRLRLPDDSHRWLSAYAAVRSNRIFGVSFDVTDRKLAEAELRESERRLRVATSAAALGVFEWKPKTDYAVWENDRMYEIMGRKRANGPLSKQQFVDTYLHPDDVHDFEIALEEAIQTGGPFHAVCRIRREDGSRRWLQIEGTFATGGTTGDPQRLIGVVADITTRKTLERRAQRFSERLATIQEEERRKIAQELHDSTVQHLVATSLGLMNLRPAASLQPKEDKLWTDVEASLGEAMKELRTSSYLMHPPILRSRRLRYFLRQYVDGFASRSGLEVELGMNPKVDRLPLRLQVSLSRIVQETLGNVYHHASASHVSIQLRWIGDRLHLVITDNGRGVEVRQLRPGVGMPGIKGRLEEFAGKLRITRVRPNGTRLHATIPVCDAARRAWTRGARARPRRS
jgi:PAS domain S-box-containing protein